MPSTGKMYGLKQTWWYDGRKDVVAATHAALDYLQYLAGRFDGDWELALAAYNAGAAKVKRAIRRNEKAGKPTDFWSLKLPRETRAYVPRLLATSKVIGNPEAYGVALDPIPNQPYFGLVDIETQLDLALAADMADMSFEDLRKLNPGFNRWATDPLGPHQLSLPTDKIPGFMEALSRLDPDQHIQWKRYRIKRGDSLSVIARRHQTTVGVVKQANKLKSSRIRAGKYLLIPVASSGENTRYAAAKISSPQSGPQGTGRIDHTVRNGDNLWTLARNYRVSHRSLAKWNGISTKDTIYPGQKLVIWSENPGSGY
jgi:membrane-bound lytic murein transglycosylase D